MPINTFHQTDTFSDWLMKFKDIKARARVVTRVRSAEHGNFGDCAPVGEGVSEMCLHFGPGYRLYFGRKAVRCTGCLPGAIKVHKSVTLSEPNSCGAKSRS